MAKNCTTIELGNLGESLAKTYFEEQGCDILYSNYRTRFGEIDIIVMHNDTIVFVEVKTYNAYGIDSLEYVISAKKQKRIVNVARRFLSDCTISYDYIRFDVIFIDAVSHKLSHIADAFTG